MKSFDLWKVFQWIVMLNWATRWQRVMAITAVAIMTPTKLLRHFYILENDYLMTI